MGSLAYLPYPPESKLITHLSIVGAGVEASFPVATILFFRFPCSTTAVFEHTECCVLFCCGVAGCFGDVADTNESHLSLSLRPSGTDHLFLQCTTPLELSPTFPDSGLLAVGVRAVLPSRGAAALPPGRVPSICTPVVSTSNRRQSIAARRGAGRARPTRRRRAGAAATGAPERISSHDRSVPGARQGNGAQTPVLLRQDRHL